MNDKMITLVSSKYRFHQRENSDGYIDFNYTTSENACLRVHPSDPTMLDVNGNHSIPLFPSRHLVRDVIPIRSFWTGFAEMGFSITSGFCDHDVPPTHPQIHQHLNNPPPINGNSGSSYGYPHDESSTQVSTLYHLLPNNDSFSLSRQVMILPYDGIAQKMFFYMTFAMVLLNMFIIGLENHPKWWRKDWKRFRQRMLPVIVRYIANPLVAIGLCATFGLENRDVVTAMLISVLPGCGFSRLMSYLFGGNKNLSYTQGLYSVLASSVTIPLVLLLIQLCYNFLPFLDPENDPLKDIKIEFMLGFFMFCIPVLPGVGLRYLVTKSKSIPSVIVPQIGQYLKPLTLSLSLCVLAFGLYTHMFVFFKFSSQQLGWVILYPLFSSGCSLAFSCLLKQTSDELVTSICEWWMQNIGVALAVAYHSMRTLHAAMALKLCIPYALWVFGLNVLYYTARASIREWYRRRESQKLTEIEEIDQEMIKRASVSLSKRRSTVASRTGSYQGATGTIQNPPNTKINFEGLAQLPMRGQNRQRKKEPSRIVMPDLSRIPRSRRNSDESSSDLSDTEKGSRSNIDPNEIRRPSFVSFGPGSIFNEEELDGELS